MSWHQPIIEVRQAHLRATLAEQAGQWHLVAQHYLYCHACASEAGDKRAQRFFAAKLALAYDKMAMFDKASYYRTLC
jgi:hypothetical protein